MNTIDKLAALQNRASSYEVTLTGPGGRAYLVRYTERHTGAGLRAVLYGSARDIVAVVGSEEFRLDGGRRSNRDARVVFEGKGAGWTVQFSGRTRREAIVAGELPMIPSAPADFELP